MGEGCGGGVKRGERKAVNIRDTTSKRTGGERRERELREGVRCYMCAGEQRRSLRL